MVAVFKQGRERPRLRSWGCHRAAGGSDGSVVGTNRGQKSGSGQRGDLGLFTYL